MCRAGTGNPPWAAMCGAGTGNPPWVAMCRAGTGNPPWTAMSLVEQELVILPGRLCH